MRDRVSAVQRDVFIKMRELDRELSRHLRSAHRDEYVIECATCREIEARELALLDGFNTDAQSVDAEAAHQRLQEVGRWFQCNVR